MSDRSFDEQFDSAFEQYVPKPDANAKRAAIHSAKVEFNQAFKESTRQSSVRAAKPGFSIKHTLWRLFMSPIENKMAFTAFGTVAVGLLALSVVTKLPEESNISVADTNRLDQANEVARTATLESKLVKRTENDSFVDNSTAAMEPLAIEEVIPTARRVIVPTDTVESEQHLASGADIVSAGKSKKTEVAEAIGSISAEELASIAAAPMAKPVQAREKRQSLQSRNVKQMPAQTSLSSIAPTVPAEPHGFSTPNRPDAGEEYAEYASNPVIQVADQAISTFSVDVDTASYSLIRNQLNSGLLPKPQAIRAEELINYFDYDYPLAKIKSQPFQPNISVLDSPWNEGRKLVHIGIKGYDLAPTEQPNSNLVFLLDVSGSMNEANKLPLVKQSMGLLLESLKPTDTVSIVVYAGAAGTVLEPTQVSEKSKILNALNNLQAGGSTAGGQGIRLAYDLAERNFSKDSVNRILLATDGDFNVGQSSNQDLKTLIERKRDKGVLLSVLGFGRNNYQDDMMQTLAQNGNGVAAYIDTLSEAKKVLVDEATSTLFPIAKDVKLQVEFNPQTVADYRLVGYETRALKREDFNNDKVDAGDIGAGHTVTAIYEITPQNSNVKSVDELRYQSDSKQDSHRAETVTQSDANEYGFLKIRYKLPNENKSKLIETVITTDKSQANSETNFAIAVAGFAQLMGNNQHTGSLSYDDVISLANANKGRDEFGYRTEFIQLVRMAKIAKP